MPDGNSHILNMLNVEHDMGPHQWNELFRWDNDRGEIGVYRTTDNDFSSELMYIFLCQNGRLSLWQYNVRNYRACINDAQTIARFAGAVLRKQTFDLVIGNKACNLQGD